MPYRIILKPNKNAGYPVDLMHASKPIWCSACAKPYVGSKWTCACNRIWHHCPIHAPILCTTRPGELAKRKVPDPVCISEAQIPEVPSSSSSSSSPNIREGPPNNDNAAVLAEVVPPLAAAGAAADVTAAAVKRKQRSRPFRIPKRT